MRCVLATLALAAALAACAPHLHPPPGQGLAAGLAVEVRNDYPNPVTVYAVPGRVRLGRVPALQARTFTIPRAAVGDDTRIMVCEGGTVNPASRCATTSQALLAGLYVTEAVWVYESTKLFVSLAPGKH